MFTLIWYKGKEKSLVLHSAESSFIVHTMIYILCEKVMLDDVAIKSNSNHILLVSGFVNKRVAVEELSILFPVILNLFICLSVYIHIM